jgi:small subunit ribosomal protein S9
MSDEQQAVAEPVKKSPRRGSDVLATGRRKTAVARVRLRKGSGQIVINGRALDAYFPATKDRALVSGALETGGRRSGSAVVSLGASATGAGRLSAA